MPDYIPAPDGDFDSWVTNFITYAAANLANLGLVAGDLTPISAAQSVWATNFAANTAAQAAAQGARQNKDAARASLETLIRRLTVRLQASPDVNNAEKALLGITVPDLTPTPVGPPTTRPVLKVDTRQRLQHTIHFSDEASPTSKRKPAGVNGAEIYVKLSAVNDPTPTDLDTFIYVATDTRTPYTLDFDGPDGGKNAHYAVRWVNTKGEKGPWSETASATVGA